MTAMQPLEEKNFHLFDTETGCHVLMVNGSSVFTISKEIAAALKGEPAQSESLLEELGLAERSSRVLIALDKLAKQGRTSVLAEMTAAGGLALTASQAERVVALAETRGDSAVVLDRIEGDFGRNAKAVEGIARRFGERGKCVVGEIGGGERG